MLPMYPHYRVEWRKIHLENKDFMKTQWLVIGTQELWMHLMMKHCMKCETPEKPEHRRSRRSQKQDMCNWIKTWFDSALHQKRVELRAIELVMREKFQSPCSV